MRISIFTDNFVPKVDGIVTRLTMTVRALIDAGDDVQIFCPDDAPSTYHGAEIVGLPSVRLPSYPEVKLALPTRTVSAALNRFQPDVIHVVNAFGLLGVGGIWFAKRKKIPLVASYHVDLLKYADFYRWPAPVKRASWKLVRAAHNQAALTLCTSTPLGADLRSSGVQRVTQWPRAVDTELFHPHRASSEWRNRLLGTHSDNGALLLYVGRLAVEKEIEQMRLVLDALPDARLALVGDGPHRRQLERHFAGTATTFLGYLSGEQLAAAYASADAFVLTSCTETLGLVLLEAMAAGCPVIAANRGGIPDVVQDGVTGFLYEPGRPGDLVAQSKRLLSNAALRQAMSRSARQEAERWSWKSATDELRRQYVRAVGANPTRRRLIASGASAV
ncbi:glycosyltransferase [Mycobacterium sp. TY814]|uniref:glycosyltransferase n=1 Tax=unclassified Mycobacterium TaxID=2642494 RepID=UPI002740D736|nr:glycosyltransferase [Mycobacterium sp. TY814]MDP7726362.1 glycosyltransferase [Mycobacterium sp. TY814]